MPEHQPEPYEPDVRNGRDQGWRWVVSGSAVVLIFASIGFGLLGWNNPGLGGGPIGMLNGVATGLLLGISALVGLSAVHLLYTGLRCGRRWAQGNLLRKGILSAFLWTLGLAFFLFVLAQGVIGLLLVLADLLIALVIHIQDTANIPARNAKEEPY